MQLIYRWAVAFLFNSTVVVHWHFRCHRSGKYWPKLRRGCLRLRCRMWAGWESGWLHLQFAVLWHEWYRGKIYFLGPWYSVPGNMTTSDVFLVTGSLCQWRIHLRIRMSGATSILPKSEGYLGSTQRTLSGFQWVSLRNYQNVSIYPPQRLTFSNCMN